MHAELTPALAEPYRTCGVRQQPRLETESVTEVAAEVAGGDLARCAALHGGRCRWHRCHRDAADWND